MMAGVIAPRLAHRLGSLPSLPILVALAGAASYAMLGVKAWWASAVLLLAASTCNTTSIITVVSLRQQVIPQALQSRVNTTARMIAFGAGYAAGATAAGGLAERMSAVGALRIVFVALVVAAVLAGATMPRISKLRGPSPHPPTMVEPQARLPCGRAGQGRPSACSPSASWVRQDAIDRGEAEGLTTQKRERLEAAGGGERPATDGA
jgi:MFS family permease